jgi:hypothetical protein
MPATDPGATTSTTTPTPFDPSACCTEAERPSGQGPRAGDATQRSQYRAHPAPAQTQEPEQPPHDYPAKRLHHHNTDLAEPIPPSHGPDPELAPFTPQRPRCPGPATRRWPITHRCRPPGNYDRHDNRHRAQPRSLTAAASCEPYRNPSDWTRSNALTYAGAPERSHPRVPAGYLTCVDVIAGTDRVMSTALVSSGEC